jgi:hypothetical protein
MEYEIVKKVMTTTKENQDIMKRQALSRLSEMIWSSI